MEEVKTFSAKRIYFGHGPPSPFTTSKRWRGNTDRRELSSGGCSLAQHSAASWQHWRGVSSWCSRQTPNCISAGWSWRGASSIAGVWSNNTKRDWSCGYHIHAHANIWVTPSMLLKVVVIRSFCFGRRECLPLLPELWREKQDPCGVMRVSCWLPQRSLLNQTRCALPNTAGQHSQRNGFFSLLPWRWSDQTANEMSDGAGDIIPYAAGWMWENNAVNQVSPYQSSSSWLVKKVAKGSSVFYLGCCLLLGEWSVFKTGYFSPFLS